MTTYISDGEFAQIYSAHHIINSYDLVFNNNDDTFWNKTFTDAQIAILCENISDLEGMFVEKLVARKELTQTNIDMILRCGLEYDMLILIAWCDKLERRHIEFFMGHASGQIREAARNHQLCTDEMKVAYHLKWGNDGA